MSLTIGGGPLSGKAPETVNYTIEGPPHRLFFHDFGRRVRCVFAGETIVDTMRGMLLHETGLLPVLYAPFDDLRTDLLEETDHTTHCPFKGDASYWSVRVGDAVAQNAVWSYPDALPQSPWLAGYAAVYWSAMDAWFDENEQVEGHLRDPYHRVDVRSAVRHVRVLAGDRTVAETDNPIVLAETGLPLRYYIPRTDVDESALEPSAKRTVCPYKGTASYWSLRVGDGLLADAAWAYPVPLPEAAKLTGHLCFLHDALTVEAAGAPADT